MAGLTLALTRVSAVGQLVVIHTVRGVSETGPVINKVHIKSSIR